jgi:ABC-type uncharacterized transport system involved in gliding motility auxiliary subunit
MQVSVNAGIALAAVATTAKMLLDVKASRVSDQIKVTELDRMQLSLQQERRISRSQKAHADISRGKEMILHALETNLVQNVDEGNDEREFRILLFGEE